MACTRAWDGLPLIDIAAFAIGDFSGEIIRAGAGGHLFLLLARRAAAKVPSAQSSTCSWVNSLRIVLTSVDTSVGVLSKSCQPSATIAAFRSTKLLISSAWSHSRNKVQRLQRADDEQHLCLGDMSGVPARYNRMRFRHVGHVNQPVLSDVAPGRDDVRLRDHKYI